MGMGLRRSTAGAVGAMMGGVGVVVTSADGEPSILEFDEATLSGRPFLFESGVAGREVDEGPRRFGPGRIDLGLLLDSKGAEYVASVTIADRIGNVGSENSALDYYRCGVGRHAGGSGLGVK